MKAKHILSGLLMAVSLLALPGCAQDAPEEKPLEQVTVILDWFPNTNHTGLYAAQDLGYYREAGLDVKMVQPVEGAVPQLIAAGKGQFGISYQEEVTMARAENMPIKAIAAVIQHNTSGFASPAAKNIISPSDFENKIYGGWGSPSESATLKYLMEKNGADFSKVKIVNMGSADFFTSMASNADFAWIFYGWTGIEAEIKNVPLNFIELRREDPALDYYTPVIIASESSLAGNPDLARRFMDATSRGYQYAIDHPDQAADILIKAAPELDPVLVKHSQRFLASHYQSDSARWGEMKLERWTAYADFLYNNQLLTQKS